MKKRGQTFSVDLIIGMAIFVITLIFFFNYTKDLTKPEEKKLLIEGEFVFNNLEYGIKEDNIKFLENYKVSEEKLINFAEKSYFQDSDGDGISDKDTQKYYVLGNFPMEGFKKIEFCIYFTKVDGSNEVVIPVNSKTGVGFSSAVLGDKIFIEKDASGLLLPCADNSNSGVANPSCGQKYTHAVRVSKPVLFDYKDDSKNNETAKINILICGERANE